CTSGALSWAVERGPACRRGSPPPSDVAALAVPPSPGSSGPAVAEGEDDDGSALATDDAIVDQVRWSTGNRPVAADPATTTPASSTAAATIHLPVRRFCLRRLGSPSSVARVRA